MPWGFFRLDFDALLGASRWTSVPRASTSCRVTGDYYDWWSVIKPDGWEVGPIGSVEEISEGCGELSASRLP